MNDLQNSILTTELPETDIGLIDNSTTLTGDLLFPPVWDSSMLSAFRACPQKFLLQYVEHWKPQRESVHLVAGGAFAKGIEVARQSFFVDGYSDEDSVALGLQALIEAYGDFEPPDGSSKTCERMAGALEFYFANYPLGADGTSPITLPGGGRGIEFSFAEALPIRHPQTGDPILFSGRADAILDAFGGTYLCDEKTTSSLGPTWSQQWDLRGQFTGYTWAARRASIPVNGCIIRGVSILKTKYDTQQAITNRSDLDVERWFRQTVFDIKLALQMWQNQYWSYNFDSACTEYGGCSFRNICKAVDKNEWLPLYFEQRVWDPLSRRELTPAEWDAEWRQHRVEMQEPE